MPEPLNTYETRLLDELHTHLASQPVPASTPRRVAPTARWAIAAGVAATIGGVAIVHTSAQPAWAVDPHSDGTVTITVNRPEGAPELQARLKELGIAADVQFPPEGKKCTPGRINDANTASDTESQVIQGTTMGSKKVAVVVAPSKMVKGTTLVLEVSALDHIRDNESDGIIGNVGVVHGKVPACVLLPLTAADFPPAPQPSR